MNEIENTGGTPPVTNEDLERAGIETPAPIENQDTPETQSDEAVQVEQRPEEQSNVDLQSDPAEETPVEEQVTEQGLEDQTGEKKDVSDTENAEVAGDVKPDPAEALETERKRRVGFQTLHQKSTEELKQARTQHESEITTLQTQFDKASGELESAKNEMRALLIKARDEGDAVDPVKQYEQQDRVNTAARQKERFEMKMDTIKETADRDSANEIRTFISNNDIPTEIAQPVIDLITNATNSKFPQYDFAVLTQKALIGDYLMAKLPELEQEIQTTSVKQARELVTQTIPRAGAQPAQVTQPEQDRPIINNKPMSDNEWKYWQGKTGEGSSFIG